MDHKPNGAGHASPATKLRAAAVAVALIGAASNAAAFFDDRLGVFVGESVTHENNIFRVPDATSDTYRSTTVGFNADTSVSRQRFLFGADWSQLRYNSQTQLDHSEHNGHANWLWEAGDRASGNLGYTESKTLASFTNFPGSTGGNLIRTQVVSGSANYLLTPRWQLQAIASTSRQRNEQDARKVQDVDVDSLQLGANYISPAGNRVGGLVREDKGRYPNQQGAGITSFSNNYSQHGLGATTDWTLTGKSHVAAQAVYVRRDYEQFSSRDYSGMTYRAAYDWLATAKSSVSVVAQRDISATEDLQTSFVLLKGIAVTPSYAFSEKLRLSASLSANIRDYLGDPGIVANPFAGRVDHLYTGAVSLNFLPAHSISLGVSAQRERRTSNMPGLDYTANIININGRLTF